MSLRDLPSVDRLMQLEAVEGLVVDFGRSLTVEAVRESLEAARAAVRSGQATPQPTELVSQTRARLENWLAPTLRPLINATGVIIHTNLGRAPLSLTARRAVQEVAAGYSSLEFDLPRGQRGNRDEHCEQLLVRLTGAEAALVVNNNAAAVLLALTGLARRKEVLVSRTQLIEIGGGFRIPDILKQSGAKLVEVGTTNRTHLRDYRSAISERTALILLAHHSNFKIIGFAAEPELAELVELAREHKLPVLHDLGSGSLLDTRAYGLGAEPRVQDSVRSGAALTAFSGDKLLGGPQAGVLVGERELIAKLRRHPMARAVRADKLCLAALSATLLHYVREEAEAHIPVWTMISAPEADLKRRAEGWQARLGRGEVIEGRSTVGGGSLPEETLPTWLLSLAVSHASEFARRLRELDRPIIGRIQDARLVLDPRTVLPDEEEALLAGLAAALQSVGGTAA
ncbi:MAG: L-seryl-tRNA(Sec) selenium transferase [Anaerolineales bacterium]